ncbi:MAG TPA: hypothetical protein VGS60_07905 [Actinomycetes bacterium]|jgi:hypothetical protein|nr:hypothetical protein [Actinomycetes bacterium]
MSTSTARGILRPRGEASRLLDHFCDRCGFSKPPEDLRTMTLPMPNGPGVGDEIEVKVCGKCRSVLNGKGSR